MEYIIFGGSGFIGTHLIDLITKIKPEVPIYNLDIVKNEHNKKSSYIYCDVRKEIKLNFPIRKDAIIFNLAAVHRTPGHPDEEYFETNIKGATNICDFAENNGINKIVFTSSIAPYGAGEDLRKEDSLPTPNTPYGISKLVAEQIHRVWQAGSLQRTLLIVRPGVVFGKGENGNFTRLYWGIRKRQFFYPGRRNTIKASIYVKDLVSFIMYQIQKQEGEVSLYNCTYEPAFSIYEIVETMSQITGLKSPKLKINSSLMIIASSIIGMFGGKKLGIHPDRVKKLMISTNISGVRLKESGYKFKYSLEEAIEDWFKDNDEKFLK